MPDTLPEIADIAIDQLDPDLDDDDAHLEEILGYDTPIWAEVVAELGYPYKPVVMVDTLAAAHAISSPEDPIWAEVRAALGLADGQEAPDVEGDVPPGAAPGLVSMSAMPGPPKAAGP